jgi:hypothetical protein
MGVSGFQELEARSFGSSAPGRNRTNQTKWNLRMTVAGDRSPHPLTLMVPLTIVALVEGTSTVML